MANHRDCPIANTAVIIGRKWTLLIVRDLARGPRRFGELERSLTGISPRTLSQRLGYLERTGVISRKHYAEVPPRVEYALTPQGQELVPIIELMRDYGERWLAGAAPEEGDN